MPICPECGGEIDYLEVSGTVSCYGTVSRNSTCIYWGETGDNADWEAFSCPECGETLFDSSSAAMAFMREVRDSLPGTRHIENHKTARREVT